MPALLPSISTSRGWTTTASATAGFVTAMRVTSNGVLSTVERPAVRTIRSKPLVSAACAAASRLRGILRRNRRHHQADERRADGQTRNGTRNAMTNTHFTDSSVRLAPRIASTV